MYILTALILVETDLHGLIGDDAIDIGGQVVQDLKRQVAEWLLGALDPLAWVRLSEGDAEVLSHGLHFAGPCWLRDFTPGGFGKSVQVRDAVFEIIVLDSGLKAKLVLSRAGKCDNQIHSRSDNPINHRPMRIMCKD